MTSRQPESPRFCPTRLSVGGTVTKPVYVFSDIGHSVECTMTNTTALMPSPNHSRASGISAMAGSGLNIEVSVSRISAPSRVVTASVVSTSAMPAPMAMPVSSTFSDWPA